MEWESGRPYNGHEESNARLQDMRKSLQEQDDLDAGLSSPCKYLVSYHSLKNISFCARLV